VTVRCTVMQHSAMHCTRMQHTRVSTVVTAANTLVCYIPVPGPTARCTVLQRTETLHNTAIMQRAGVEGVVAAANDLVRVWEHLAPVVGLDAVLEVEEFPRCCCPSSSRAVLRLICAHTACLHTHSTQTPTENFCWGIWRSFPSRNFQKSWFP